MYMSRILISFVGTGKTDRQNLKSERCYLTTCYHIGNRNIGDYPFVAAGIMASCHIDKVILIGTTHSMWEEVYRYFAEQNNQTLDEAKYLAIADYCEKATSDTIQDIPFMEDIEKSIGDAKIVLIRYGLNDDEIDENVKRILLLDSSFNTGDELIIDITHAFRSLPLMIMNLLIYLKNVSRRNIRISHIYYAMLEVLQENNLKYGEKYAPIVDLRNILSLNDWIIGSYSFSQYGNAYKISELLDNIDRDMANRLRSFSDEMNLNHIDAIEEETKKMRSLKNKEYKSKLPELIVKPVIDDFLKTFRIDDNHALFQFKLAEWQYKHMNYAASLISLMESMITWVCLQEKLNWRDYQDREKAKEKIKAYPDLCRCYYKIKKSRNCVAHSIENENNAANMIKTLKINLEKVKRIIS